MSLKYFVYVGAVNNLSDARYCSAMMVDIIGFDVNEFSVKCLNEERFKEISTWINGVEIIGDFENSSEEHISKFINENHFSSVMIDIRNHDLLNNLDVDNVILKVNDKQYNEDFLSSILDNHKNLIKILVFESFNDSKYRFIKSLNNKLKILVKPLHSSVDTKKMLDKYNLGLYLNGSDEIRPGYKDYDSLSEILEDIEDSF